MQIEVREISALRQLPQHEKVEADDRGLVSLLFTRSGSIKVSQDGRAAMLAQLPIFVRSDSPFTASATGRVSLVRVTVASADLHPRSIHTLPMLTATTVLDSSLVRSTVALVLALATFDAKAPSRAPLERALLVAIDGTLAQHAASARLTGAGDRALLLHASQAISDSSADNSFGPVELAEALGIKVRRLHRLYESEPLSVTETIRAIRLERIAKALANPANTVRLANIAREGGFAGLDQCARAFKAHYGHSMGAHRRLSRSVT